MKKLRALAVMAVPVGILITLSARIGSAQLQHVPKLTQPVEEQNNPGFEPFQRVLNCFETSIDGTFCPPSAIVTVPAGKRLVVEYLSGRIHFLGNTIKLTTTAGRQQGTYSWSLSSDGDGRLDGTLARIYADPGSRLIVWNDGGIGLGFGEFVISGHLVTLPGN